MIGAGNRAHAYAPYALAHPSELRFVAVAEPHAVRRARFARAHAIETEQMFCTWEDLLARGKIADVAFVCTMDRLHVAPTVAALEAGYDVLLEKPMATDLAGCVGLVQAAERTGRWLQVCHVLRYTAFFSALHDVIASGRLGDIVTVEHRENVVYWHMAHSYVRGNWRNSRESPMILAKCCHDLDILYWNLGPCTRLGSFGSLLHFRAENAPDGAPERCTDGCPHAGECPWYAPRLYVELAPLMQIMRRSESRLERVGAGLALDHPAVARTVRRIASPVGRALDYRGWPVSAISEDTSPEARLSALRTGPYGRCVFRCDNDVVDHQTVNLELESGASVVLVMHGHSHEEGRTMRYDGTRATLRARFTFGSPDVIEIHDHLTGRVERVSPRATAGGHGGGDEGIVAAFLRAVRDPSAASAGEAATTARESLESHLMAFAAEQARIEGAVVDMARFRKQWMSSLKKPRRHGEHREKQRFH
jgi:predicted dehydrogenase